MPPKQFELLEESGGATHEALSGSNAGREPPRKHPHPQLRGAALTGITTTVTNLPLSLVGNGPGGACQILHLHIGAIDLNLLGLQVNLAPVDLDITAQPGPGNLLGNLLCAVANLLNGGGPLAGLQNLLNQINAILAGL